MHKTQLMGILNVTPDSFFEKSRAMTVQNATEIAVRMQKEGADILDIGGESSRPGSHSVSAEEELNRVVPVIEALKEKISIPISIDTTKPQVAEEALKAGARILNDITGFSQSKMIDAALKYEAQICVMHMQGTPQTMQRNPSYPEGVVQHILHWFEQKIDLLLSCGIDPKKIILDPGIGFGKTVADNLEIIHNLPLIKRLGYRVLIGVSRKSFIAKVLNQPVEELLPGTLAMNTLAIMADVDMIRVHDIKEHRSLIDLMYVYKADIEPCRSFNC